MTLEKLEKMWDEFADIPTNLDDEIDVNFYCWEKGTYRFVMPQQNQKSCFPTLKAKRNAAHLPLSQRT